MVKRLLFLLFIFSVSAGIFRAQSPTSSCTIPSVKQDSILSFAYLYLGVPYKYAGTSPKGFDCSGFVYFVFRHYAIDLPRTSRDMGRAGIEVPIDSCRAGDIILFKGTNARSKGIGHAGIVTWSDGKDVQFIHSSSNKKRGGVILSCFSDSPYYEKRFIKVVRVLP
ncbi:MAG: C40 family peptidase [Bacteroidia bacterium]|nr:C40 family peptidase [Bacteroidia bacterium]